MPADWTRTSIGDCLSENFTGEWGTSPNPSRANALVLRSTNLDDDGHVELSGGAPRVVPRVKLAAKRLRDGDILLEASGGGPGKPVGRVAVFRDDANGPYLCSNFFRTLRPDERTDSAFLGWRLLHLHRAPEIWHYQQQTTGIINLKHADYFAHEIELPPLPEQRRIAEILDTLDEAIRRTEQVIAKLQQMKQGLLHDLLTRGIDEHGELRDPERHPEQFKDSPLGRIPREWEVRPLAEVAEFVTSGSRGWAAHYADTGALFIRIGNLTRDHINLRFDSVVRVRPPRSREGRRTSVEAGDLLISITADLGIVGVAPADLSEAYVNQHVALVRLDRAVVNPRWVGHYLARGAGQEQFTRLNDQGAKAGLNLPAVAGLSAAQPRLPEQAALAAILDGHDRRIADELRTAEKLRTLKQGLMHDLLTGRVRTLPSEATA